MTQIYSLLHVITLDAYPMTDKAPANAHLVYNPDQEGHWHVWALMS